LFKSFFIYCKKERKEIKLIENMKSVLIMIKLKLENLRSYWSYFVTNVVFKRGLFYFLALVLIIVLGVGGGYYYLIEISPYLQSQSQGNSVAEIGEKKEVVTPKEENCENEVEIKENGVKIEQQKSFLRTLIRPIKWNGTEVNKSLVKIVDESQTKINKKNY